MKQTTCAPTGVPSAYIALNKSRIKIYHKDTNPTYYLDKGTEFMIEVFNPTSDTVLAKIHLNGTAIAQGGLVLRPGERVFLERYIDVAKKFKFDTYEVSNTAEVKAAIRENGDLKVEFYRESKPSCYPVTTWYNNNYYYNTLPYNQWPYNQWPYSFTTCGSGNLTGTVTTAGAGGIIDVNCSTSSTSYNASNGTFTSNVTMDSLISDEPKKRESTLKPSRSLMRSKSIETGRVEQGASSDQKLEYVDKSFDSYAFHTVEYKLLPVSQKVNTSEDLSVKRYCTNCGSKQKQGHKFCPNCGAKA